MGRKRAPTATKRQKPILRPAVRAGILANIEEDETYVKGLERGERAHEGGIAAPDRLDRVDVSKIKNRIKRNKRIVEQLSPQRETSVAKRNSIKKEMEADEEWFRENMLSTWDQGAFPAPGDHEKDAKYRRAIAKSVKQEVGNPEFVKRAERFKRNAAKLDPDDPELADLEKFRSTRKTD